jgi:hypothetical protein
VVGHARQSIDVVHRVFGKPAVGGESVGAVPLVDLAVIQPVVQAGGVHALPAALALSAAGMDLDRDPLADRKFVDTGPERRDFAHVLVARREVLVEGQPALDLGRRAVVNHLQVGGADGYRIDANEHFRLLGNRDRLLAIGELVGITENPRPHRLWHDHRRGCLHAGRGIHRYFLMARR